MRAADDAFQRGGARVARELLDCHHAFVAADVQVLARLAQVSLDDAAVTTAARWRVRIAVAAFLASLAAGMKSRRLHLGALQWSTERIGDVAARARHWLEQEAPV